MSVTIYTDGAASGNPGPGGYGVVMESGKYRKELWEGFRNTTNNRMELLAAISALETLGRATAITIVTDSAYVKDGITSWIHGWKKRGWKTSANKPVKNEDLWRRLDSAVAQHQVRWEWVKGHAGHVENERADELARAGMAPYKP